MSTYGEATSSSDGNTISYKLTGPLLLDPKADGADLIRKAEQAAVRAAGAQALRRARGAYSPPAIRAGWLLSTRTVGLLSVAVTNPVPLATWVEDGTRPHDIVPTTKKALHWGGPGGDVFATRVQHPGTPGKHRLPALQAHLAASFEAQIAKRVTPLLQGNAAYTGAE